MIDWPKMIEALKSAPRILVGLFLAAGFVLFAPSEVLDYLDLRELAKVHRPWIAGTVLLSGGLLISHLGYSGWEALSGWRRKRAEVEDRKRAEAAEAARMMQRLQRLTPAEKRVLLRFVSQNTRTCNFDIRDGVVGTLAQANILYRPTSFGHPDSFAFSVQPWAWDLLMQNPQLLEPAVGPSDGPHHG